jgi:hypothetical protein
MKSYLEYFIQKIWDIFKWICYLTILKYFQGKDCEYAPWRLFFWEKNIFEWKSVILDESFCYWHPNQLVLIQGDQKIWKKSPNFSKSFQNILQSKKAKITTIKLNLKAHNIHIKPLLKP